jgi:hypothetical protein
MSIAPLPTVPAPIKADTYANLLSPKSKTDPKLAKASAAVAKNPRATIVLDDGEWDLKDPAVFDMLPRNVTGLLLYGKVDLARLTAFPDLERLSLMGTIQNWEALGALKKLKVLDIAMARLRDLSFLGDSAIEALNLHNCHFESLANLSQLTRLRQLDIHAKVADAGEWQALAALTSLERARIYTYSKVVLPDLGKFPRLAYLSVSAPEIEFDADALAAAPALEALGLDGAPYMFLSTPQGVRAGAAEKWAKKLLLLAESHPMSVSKTLKRIYLGDMPATQRKTLAEWLHAPCTRDEEQLLKKNFVPLYDDKLEAQAEKRYAAAVKAIQKRVKEAVGKKCYVEYSAYDNDPAGLPRDNLDEVCFEGRCRIEEKSDDGPAFQSEELTDPTWLQVAVVANAMIVATNKDTDHRFLEGVHVLRKEGGVTVLGLEMGS